MNVKSYEWKNNQYKESVISYENELCHLLENDIFVFKIVRHYSTLPKKCPVPVGIIIFLINNNCYFLNIVLFLGWPF